jgi:hypothetical protein
MSMRHRTWVVLFFSTALSLGCTERLPNPLGESTDERQSGSSGGAVVGEVCEQGEGCVASCAPTVDAYISYSGRKVCCSSEECGYISTLDEPECVAQGKPKGHLVCGKDDSGHPQWQVRDGGLCTGTPCANACAPTVDAYDRDSGLKVCCPSEQCGYISTLDAPECVAQGKPKGYLVCGKDDSGHPQWQVRDGGLCSGTPCVNACVPTVDAYDRDSGLKVCCPSEQCGYINTLNDPGCRTCP